MVRSGRGIASGGASGPAVLRLHDAYFESFVADELKQPGYDHQSLFLGWEDLPQGIVSNRLSRYDVSFHLKHQETRNKTYSVSVTIIAPAMILMFFTF